MGDYIKKIVLTCLAAGSFYLMNQTCQSLNKSGRVFGGSEEYKLQEGDQLKIGYDYRERATYYRLEYKNKAYLLKTSEQIRCLDNVITNYVKNNKIEYNPEKKKEEKKDKK